MKEGMIGAFFYLLFSSGCSVAGGGGSDQIVPDLVKAGEPAVVTIVFSVWGFGGLIEGRYKDITFNYRLIGERDYKTIPP